MFFILEMDTQCSVNASYFSGETEVKFDLNMKYCTGYLVNIISKSCQIDW